MNPDDIAAAPAAAAAIAITPRASAWPRGLLGPWLRQGARSALLLQPRWDGLQAHPLVPLALLLGATLLSFGLQRLQIDGPAYPYWRWILEAGLWPLILAWISYLLRPHTSHALPTRAAPSAMHLFCLASAQQLVLNLVSGLATALAVRLGVFEEQAHLGWNFVLFVWTPAIWGVLALARLFGGSGTLRARVAAAACLAGSAALILGLLQPYQAWYPRHDEDDEAEAGSRPRFELTQEATEAQPRLLAARLGELKPQRRGVVDLYAITFAPYADQDVFMRESNMVAGVMADRFDTRGRTIQLVNNAGTVGQWPWATPLNLRRAVQRAAKLMDRDEDILFLHLTSHGARSGHLAAEFGPLSVEQLTPRELKAMLDEAGIRWRVISISACFSGSWLAPLSGDGTLVMTAADADHTSYGCGRLSDLTFFGRAMYDEQLRTQTLSFEQAHAAARAVIKQREEEAGKDDGYSNPQISMGSSIRGRLDALRARLGTTVRR